MPKAEYYRPELNTLGSVQELTLGSAGAGFDACEPAAGSVLADPCAGQEFPPGSGITK